MNEEIRELLLTVLQRIESGVPLSPELRAILPQFLETITARQARENAPDELPHIPLGADLLWVMSGENPQAFIQYLRTVPDAELNQLAQDPTRLYQVMNQLSRQITMPAGESSDGIPAASLQSSNIYGFQYEPRSKRLFVKFQGNDGYGQGPVYEYEGVPPQIFKMFQQGAIPARTQGSNRWGAWWQSKSPSLGSSMYTLIKNGGFPYARVA